MSALWSRLRDSATAAHVLPLVAFMLLNGLPGLFRIENPELPWYQRAPEHWAYPLQTVLTGLLLLFFSRHYRFSPWRNLGLAGGLGIAGIAVWIAPAWFYQHAAQTGQVIPGWLSWLGVVDRSHGFDPEVLQPWPAWQNAAVGLRFVRMVVVVPLVEEIFWRGFLMRYVQAGSEDWQRVPFGRHSWKAFWIVTLLVTAAHGEADWCGAFVWGSLMYLLAVKSRSLGACIVMHAVGNLLLGLYVMQTRQWGFW